MEDNILFAISIFLFLFQFILSLIHFLGQKLNEVTEKHSQEVHSLLRDDLKNEFDRRIQTLSFQVDQSLKESKQFMKNLSEKIITTLFFLGLMFLSLSYIL